MKTKEADKQRTFKKHSTSNVLRGNGATLSLLY
jgi:hypothetical protein